MSAEFVAHRIYVDLRKSLQDGNISQGFTIASCFIGAQKGSTQYIYSQIVENGYLFFKYGNPGVVVKGDSPLISVNTIKF